MAMSTSEVGENFSSPLSITIGTFQGTCLGPLLCNITSNDLACYIIPSHINGLKATVVRYADDAKIAVTCLQEKLRDHQMSMKMLLKALGHWFEQHGKVFLRI